MPRTTGATNVIGVVRYRDTYFCEEPFLVLAEQLHPATLGVGDAPTPSETRYTEYQPTTSKTTWLVPRLLKTDTLPSAPTLAMTRLGTV